MQVGDYVRTTDGIIGKYYEKEVEERIPCLATGGYRWGKVLKKYINDDEYECFNFEDRIVKSSSNIIDLIEVGDYVNGDKVEKNKYGELYTGYVYCGGEIGRTEESYTLFLKDMEEEDIESIVTQEQFEKMEYKIGESK